MANEQIYIVEDERVVAIDLQRRLERLGYRVCGNAADGDSALKGIRETRPDIILMDILIQGSTDGISIALQIRDELDIPVVFLSSYTDQETMERAKEASPVGFILKPFKESELATLLEMALFKNMTDSLVKQKDQLFSAILNSTTDAILVVGPAGEVVFLNPGAERLLEITDEEGQKMQAMNLFTLTHKESGDPYIVKKKMEHNRLVRANNLRLTNRNNNSFIVDITINLENTSTINDGNHIISFKDISRLDEITDTLKYQASHDTLTGLLNRTELAARLNAIMQSTGQPCIYAFFIDIDHFKILNDSCGTQAGDLLINDVATSIKKHVHERSFAARIGGDDFVLIYYSDTEAASAQNIADVAKQILDSAQKNAFSWNGREYPYTLSIGIIPIDSSFKSEHEIMIAGTQTVQKVHKSGGNHFAFFEQNNSNRYYSLPISEWITRIHTALQEDGFRLYYQPIEPLAPEQNKKQIEILLRMTNNDNSIILPGEFIPIAERYNIMPTVDRWVIENSFKTYARLAKKNHPITHSVFGLNISGSSLLDDSLASFILQKANEYAIPQHMFCIELTESSAILNLASVSRLITLLTEKGFSFALDDFGSGFSSFSYLKNLPVSFVKIDGAFIRNMDKDPIDYTMVQAISSMCRILGLKTIGEFAENATIIRMLNEIGVDYAQGYGIAKPQPFPE